MRNKTLAVIAFLLAAISPAWGQKYAYQPPVQTFGQFSVFRPMASYRCSQSQLTARTPMLQFFDPIGEMAAGVDCSGVIITGGEQLILSPPKLLEFNKVNTLTAAVVSGQNTIYTGTIPNCTSPNVLNGEWVLVAGFVSGQNNGSFGPVLGCTLTTLTVQNSGAAETHAATATNLGFQLVAAPNGYSSPAVIPRAIFAFSTGGSTGYTLGNADNVFSFTYARFAPTVKIATAHAFTLNGFLTSTASASYAVEFANLTGPVSISQTPLLVTLTGTTPALTLGDSTVLLRADYNIFDVAF